MAHMVSVVVLRCKVGITRGHYSLPRYTHHSLYSPVTRPATRVWSLLLRWGVLGTQATTGIGA